MNSFVDTNVSIAYIFSINPLNNKSMAVFRGYDNIYWSELVKNECKNVFKNKRKILVKFYKDLANDLKPDDFHNFRFNDLRKHVMGKYSDGKKRDQILSSSKKFWDTYVNERFPTNKRVDKYLYLKKKLASLNVHHPDDDIALDAHDFNLRNDFLLDFITFDEDCRVGVSKIKEFQFNKVKGKYDYL